jgi:hypothetical protein
MRCEEVHRILLEDWPEEISATVREHLAGCPACGALARECGLVRAGFRALAAEPVPGPSWGFAARVLRRLEESPAPEGLEFLERAGRRVVYASFALALTLLLALVLPSSGPLRGPTVADFYLAQQESVTIASDPILTGELAENDAFVRAEAANGRVQHKP